MTWIPGWLRQILSICRTLLRQIADRLAGKQPGIDIRGKGNATVIIQITMHFPRD